MSFKKLIKPVCVLLSFTFAASLIAFGYYWNAERQVPGFEAVRGSYKKSDVVLVDRNGVVIHEMRIDENGRRLDWAGLKDISPALASAAILSEDRRFYNHNGVDWLGVSSAMIKSPFTGRTRGASTITMQLASILDRGLQGQGYKRTIRQKIGQIRYAAEIEKKWTKDQVLEAYLNLVTFRGELQGVTAASRGLFGKEPHGLNSKEALILASLVRAPNASLEILAKRAYALENVMGTGVKAEEINALMKEALTHPYLLKPSVALAPHAAAIVLKGGERGAIIRTTLDADLQLFASEVLKEHLLTLKEQNVHDGAIIVAENSTGEILAYVGSSGELSEAGQVNGLTAKRQAGSTLKPFLYGLALDRRLITPATLIDDSPLDIPVANGIYRPMNYDTDFRGLVSARTALASSLNVPAVKVLQLTGVANFHKTLEDLGLEGLEEHADFYGPSLALGSADVALMEMAAAYRTFANEGIWSPLRISYERKGDSRKSKRIFSKEAAFLISDMLSDREARSTTFGLENPLSTRFWTAVKTGTSKDMRDNWCIGYSGKYTVGVWVGNFSGEPMWNVSGITGAAPIWIELMNKVHQNGSFHTRGKVPSGIISANVDFSGIEPQRAEWFIKGTELKNVMPARMTGNSRIIYPAQGTIIALDPDIPEGQERVLFEADTGGNETEWDLNGYNLGSGRIVSWAPEEGKYVLSIIDQQKKVVDFISFEVRGERISMK